MKPRFLPSTKVVAGKVLLGIGAFAFQQNLELVASQLHHLWGTRQMLGTMSTVILLVGGMLHTYAGDHQRFVHQVLHQTLIPFWPLLLVIGGMFLSHDLGRGGQPTGKNRGRLVDLTASRSTSK